MSRLAKKAIPVPKGVEVKISGLEIGVKGPKGQLASRLEEGLVAKIEEKGLMVLAGGKKKVSKALLGLHWALLRNMIEGVSSGFEKKLSLVGVGFRANVRGNRLDLQVGFSHPTFLIIPQGLQVKVDEKSVEITITGADKHLVGKFASEVRAMKKPEPYKGKGIRYLGEYVRKKAGKAAKAAAAAPAGK
ncbi:MAG: 50S ribosomal protein L6 [Parachlamydiales bacterium]|jgi:large subunit ribosomal protein L6